MMLRQAGTGAIGPKQTPTGSRSTSPATNGAGRRRCISWIQSFVEYTSNLESSPIYRKWAAITVLSSVLQQKVWLRTNLKPNLYTFLIGHPGIGKSRTINAARGFLRELPEHHLGATSMTMAALVDCM